MQWKILYNVPGTFKNSKHNEKKKNIEEFDPISQPS